MGELALRKESKGYLFKGPTVQPLPQTARKHTEMPPMQKAEGAKQRNTMQRAGQRQFEGPPSFNENNRTDLPSEAPTKNDLSEEQESENKTLNKYLYAAPIGSKSSKGNSELTDEFFMRQDCFGELNEASSEPFARPMFELPNTDEQSDVPQKPSIEYTSRFNDKVYTSHERGRMRKVFSKGETVGGELGGYHPTEHGSDGIEDNSDLNEFYGRKWKKENKRSRSKEVLQSQKSV
jgi:hypothetical protein